MRISIARLILFLFLITTVISGIALIYITSDLRKTSVHQISVKEVQKQSDLIFLHLFSIMKSGGGREGIKATISEINQQIPDLHLQVIRSKRLAAQYGEIEAARAVREKDIHVRRVFDTGKEAFVQKDDILRFIRPIVASSDCLVCHTNIKPGDLNGVIDIQFKEVHLQNALDESINKTLYTVALMLLVFYVLLFLGVYLFVIRPMMRLSSHMTEIRQTNDIDTQLRNESTWLTEIRELTNDYNALLRHLSQAQKTIIEQSETDALTGLYNRGKFDSELEREFSRAQRYDRCFSVMILDLNKFKPINDLHGHAAGDQVLKTFSDYLQQEVREQDIVGRIGGDEFAVIFQETGKESVQVVADRISAGMEKLTMEFEGTSLTVGVSMGIAGFPVDATEIADLLVIADQRMYENKEHSR